MTRIHAGLLTLLIPLALPGACGAAARDHHPQPGEITLPSEAPSGIEVNDQIWIRFIPAPGASPEHPSPAVVLIHGHHAPIRKQMAPYVRALAKRGIASVVLTLPYHGPRRPPHKSRGGPFVNPDPHRQRQALEQSVSDVSTVISWLQEQPGVDPEKIGVTGISLGALISHLAMGKDSRISAGVAMLGGGGLKRTQQERPGIITRRLGGRLDAEGLEIMRPVDPIEYADENRPRRVLMFEGARDWIFPNHSAEKFWEALGKPPIIWLDTGHIAPVRIEGSAARTSAAYLDAVWQGKPATVDALPRAYVPTVKIGTIFGLDSIATPAVQWQAYTFLKRSDHMSLLHADLGWSGRGPFLGLAATLSTHSDVGLAYSPTRNTIRPYLSLHLVP